MGAPIEFDRLEWIRERYGPGGRTDLDADRPARVTDDTQMTMFTAEGLIRGKRRLHEGEPPDVVGSVWRAYQRWLHTQGPSPGSEVDGWLISHSELHHRRAPGNTCLSALRTGQMGSVNHPLNQSKGCGGLMRMAPVGLVGLDDEASFHLGCDLAALTHGHPSGWLAAGSFAVMIAAAVRGAELEESIHAGIGPLRRQRRGEEVLEALEGAVAAAAERAPAPEAVEQLGAGWIAEEALAIGVYCALVAKDFASGVVLAINHSGDSDSTGSIAGNLLGAVLGEAALPASWLARLELADVLVQLADDLTRVSAIRDAPVELRDRYPAD